MRSIAKALVKRGHQVTVLTADLDRAIETQDRNARTGDTAGIKSRRGWESREDGIEAVYLQTLHNYRATTLNPQILSFCSRRLSGYDVVHIYGLYDLFGVTVSRFCHRRQIPYVLEPLGMFGPKVRSQLKKRLYGKLVGETLFANAALVIATSENERSELMAGGINAERIMLRRNGIDLDEFQSLPKRGAFRNEHNLAPEAQVILFLGRISFIKGLDLLVRAFAKLARSHPQARLIIAGPDDADGCTEVISKLVSEFALSDHVILSEPVYGQERLQAFADADVVVLPSRYESFGNVAAESVACGTPVLVTDRCGIAPLIDGSAGLVVPCSVEGLAEGMKRMLEDKRLLLELREGCANVASSLSWDEPIATMESLYVAAVNNKTSGAAVSVPPDRFRN